VRSQLRLWTKRLAVLVAGATVATVAAVVPATSASASADGTGWSASWNYYTPNWIHIQENLPGASLDAYVSDSRGVRQAQGWLSDTARDGRCARIRLLSNDIGYFVDQTVCDGGATVYFGPGRQFSGVLLPLISLEAGGSTVKSFYTFVPASADDPNLRTVGNGMSWSYYGPFNFQYDVKRAGAHHWGYGGSAVSGRWAAGTLQSDSRGACVSGKISADVSTSGSVCGTNAYTSFNGTFQGWILVEACQFNPNDGCLFGYVPDPY
jgi:hypothetical protein